MVGEEDRGKQAEFEGKVWIESLDDLPGATPDRRPVPAARRLALPAQSLCGNYLS
jgi:hypothetical protein